MVRSILLLSGLVQAALLSAQAYTSWFTGNTQDVQTQPLGGVCMMGGASEFDPAMQWFLDRANGGDVLVLRASGSDGYNDYMYSELGGVNSVETILFNDASAAYDPYVAERIQKAEAIWFAGGDQWNYVSYWRNSPVQTLINEAITQRNIAIGGTSAGMAILGGCYFSAEYGSITSSFALANPSDMEVAVDCTPFLNVPFMAHTITDTHYDNPDRRGRHFTFLARMVELGDSVAYGIACNEYVAVCVAPDGIAHVYGEYPDYQEFAYFLRVNCVPPVSPETCTAGSPLTWDRDGQAVKVYKVPGVPGGDHWFNLNDHVSGEGGAWQDWSAVAGVFSALSGSAPDCLPTAIHQTDQESMALRWDAESGVAEIAGCLPGAALHVFTPDGRAVHVMETGGEDVRRIQLPANARGMFILRAEQVGEGRTWKLVRP
jgi:cyanophycinase-like exopeptidase